MGVNIAKHIAERVTAGARFGRLTVLGFAGKRKGANSWQHDCQCDCGRKVVVRTRCLLLGHRTSCRIDRPCIRWHEAINAVGTEAWASNKLKTMRAASRKYGYAEPCEGVQRVLDLWCSCNGRCACCGQGSAHTLHLDHCHVTGRLRGFICRECNLGIGLAREDSGKLAAMASWVSLQPGS